jgi:hypothetical protein
VQPPGLARLVDTVEAGQPALDRARARTEVLGGVTTFAQLSELNAEEIEGKLNAANEPLIAGHSAATWQRQATLASRGDWSALRRYIDSSKTVAAG